MELQRPRFTPVLPQWDLGIVLEALSKPPYEPLREGSLKHLTLKTVFLLAVASGRRRSELPYIFPRVHEEKSEAKLSQRSVVHTSNSDW